MAMIRNEHSLKEVVEIPHTYGQTEQWCFYGLSPRHLISHVVSLDYN